jgi:ABC-2 type transport system permease protein
MDAGTGDESRMTQQTDMAFELNAEGLTLREVLLLRISKRLFWGAVANGILAALLVLLGFGAASGSNGGLLASLHDLVLGRYTGQNDIALMIGILLILANAGTLLVMTVGVLAQEVWSPYLIGLGLLVNLGLLVLLGFIPALLTIAFLVWAGALVARDMRAYRVNPVMLKELRGRMRGVRAFVVITVYLLLMSAVAVIVYMLFAPFNLGIAPTATGELGRTLFLAVVGIELLLIIFIAPAFTASAVTGERERKTFDLLHVTLLPVPSFITGKLQSALGYILLLLLAAIPLQSIAFLFGGVGELEVVMAFVILVMTAVTMGTVGLYFSSGAERTLTASVRSYIVAMIVTFGIPLILAVLMGYYGNALSGVSTGVKSPVLETILIYIGLILTSMTPLTTGLYTQYILIEYRQLGFVNITLSSDGSVISMISPWISFTIVYLITAAILIYLSIRRMRQADQGDQETPDTAV